jgi:hypothetical protein
MNFAPDSCVSFHLRWKRLAGWMRIEADADKTMKIRSKMYFLSGCQTYKNAGVFRVAIADAV